MRKGKAQRNLLLLCFKQNRVLRQETTSVMSMSTFIRLKYRSAHEIPTAVKVWLIAGLVMIFFQIVIGGVTRLTGSGLSITRWEIVTGAVPPLTEEAWAAEFELYKATPQYQKINEGMALDDFKFIYFWEYFHRLWARLMFFVFIIPFAWFLWRGMFSRQLVPRMLVVVLLAGFEGFLGWIMVASGLIQRPWVNAYNLTLHLTMALIIFSYLMWTTFVAFRPNPRVFHKPVLKKYAWGMLLLAFVQIALGAMMSGTKAGLFYPTWPDMHGSFLPPVLLDAGHWAASSFIEYDTNPFMPALIQFLHRNTAYILTIMILYFVWRIARLENARRLQQGNRWLVGVLLVQVALGILTVLNCVAKVPVTLGVLHQAGAVLLLSMILWVTYELTAGKKSTNVDKV